MVAEHSSADFQGTLGRYALFGEIAAGGMATVHLARLLGRVGFARTVAIKRLHPHLAKDPDFVAMFLEEARIAARVRHPNVVSTLDVVDEANELFLVMEYVAGESLSRLVRKSREAGEHVPPRYLVAIMCAALEGLHAAHEATSERGAPLGIVHRDVSPQNIHVGLDGVARVLDFGIAKATNRVQETRTDQIKGKVAYMSPEQLAKGPIDRRADVYSASVVLWEALTGKRLFKSDDVASLVYAIMNDPIVPPSGEVPDLPSGIDEIVMRGLDRDPEKRWSSAREMAVALERILTPAPPREIGEWVRETAGDMLEWRIELVHRIESQTSSSMPPPPPLRIDSPSEPVPKQTIGSGIVRSARTTEVTRNERRTAVSPEGSLPSSSRDLPPAKSLPDDERETLVQAERADAQDLDAGRAADDLTRKPIVLVAGALLLVAVCALVFRLVQLGGTEAPVTPTAPPTTSAAPSASAPPEHEPAISLELSRSATAPSTSSSAPPSAASVSPTTKAKPDVPMAAPKRNNECDNPVTVDAKGNRHPKPQCFKQWPRL